MWRSDILNVCTTSSVCWLLQYHSLCEFLEEQFSGEELTQLRTLAVRQVESFPDCKCPPPPLLPTSLPPPSVLPPPPSLSPHPLSLLPYQWNLFNLRLPNYRGCNVHKQGVWDCEMCRFKVLHLIEGSHNRVLYKYIPPSERGGGGGGSFISSISTTPYKPILAFCPPGTPLNACHVYYLRLK